MHRKRVVFDMCDNHFRTEYDSYHRKMIDVADMVTCPTEAMYKVIGGHTGVWPTVIPDPHEFEMVEPGFGYDNKDDLPLFIMWYGNNTNVAPLINLFDSEQGELIDLTMLMSFINGEKYILDALGDAQTNPWMQQYTEESVLRYLDGTDAVIIPQVDDWWGSTKSPNRLLEAVVRGRFVLANSIHSYEPFKEWMWIGDIAEGLDWLKQQPGEEICQRIKKAQNYIRLNHSIKTVADRWEDALISVVEITIGKAT